MSIDLYAWLKDNPPPPKSDQPPARVPAAPARGQRREGKVGDLQPNDHADSNCGPGSGPTAGQESEIDWTISCARNYISKKGPAISGQGGRKHTFAVATSLCIGFDLEVGEALPLFIEWNYGCQPPWELPELREKLEDARQRAAADPKRGSLKLPRKDKSCTFTDEEAPKMLPRDGDEDPYEGLPEIIVSHRRGEAVRVAVEVLAGLGKIYQRSDMLVEILRSEKDKDDSYGRKLFCPGGSPHICEVKNAKIGSILSIVSNIVTWRKDKNEEWILSPVHPPDWLISGVAADKEWAGIPKINAIVESPVIRPDGSILSEPGYDPATKVLFEPNLPPINVPETCTKEDAIESLVRLGELVGEFPFKNQEESSIHKSAWLAALLTPFARLAINGPCPLFLFDANAAGSGKSLLCDVIACIFTGRIMPRTIYTDNDEEMRKRITSLLLVGKSIVLMDNISQGIMFGGSSLDALLTAMTWQDRILGRNEMTREIPAGTVWYATGNNVTIQGDAQRRVIPCYLDCDVEKPQERQFKYMDLISHVLENRHVYVRDCLVILKAFFQAGRPEGDVKPLGSYGAWSKTVRSCVLWVSGEDCVMVQDELREFDNHANQKLTFIRGLYELPGVRSAKGQTAVEILSTIKSSPDSKYVLLKCAFNDYFGKDCEKPGDRKEYPDSRKLSGKLRSMRNCVVGGLKLLGSHNKTNGLTLWRVVELDNPGNSQEFDDKPAAPLAQVHFTEDGEPYDDPE